MKKIILSLGLMFAATFALTNCAKNDEPTDAPVLNGIKYELFAAAADTRTTNNDMKTEWASGDAINVFHIVKGGTTYQNDKNFTLADTATGRFTGSLTGTLTEGTTYDWYLFYPYNSKVTTPVSKQTTDYIILGCYNKNSYTQTQSGNDSKAHLAGTNCPMYAKVTDVTYPNPVKATMNHLASVIAVNVTNTEAEAITVTSISFTAPEDIVGTYFINFAGETVAYKASGDNYVSKTASLTVSDGTPLAQGESAQFYMLVKPFTAKANDKLSLTIKTDKGNCTKALPLTTDVAFTAGKIKTLKIGFKQETVVAEEWTVDELAAAIAGGTTTFSGKTVKGYVAAMANDNSTTLSNGTLIITSNSGNQNSAVKLFDKPNITSRAVDAEGLFVGAEVVIALDNATVGNYNGNKQLTGVTATDVQIQDTAKVHDIVPTTVTIAEYTDNVAKYENMCLAFEGVEPAQEYATANATMMFTDGTNDLKIYNLNRWTAGAAVKVYKQKGTLYGFAQSNNGAAQISNTNVAQLEAFTVLTCVLDKESVTFDAASTELETITATLGEGYTLGSVSTDVDWILADAKDNTISLMVDTNTGDERTAIVTVEVMKDGVVAQTKTIAVKQRAAGAAAEITYSVDFENETATYTNWTFDGFLSLQSGKVNTHGGNYYGTTGGKASGYLMFNNKIATPKSIVFYVTKQTSNAKSSTWKVQKSADKSTWDDIKTASATSMNQGTWSEITVDLTDYKNVYIRIFYTGSTAIRNIDDVSLTLIE